jgi:hypothetical protein
VIVREGRCCCCSGGWWLAGVIALNAWGTVEVVLGIWGYWGLRLRILRLLLFAVLLSVLLLISSEAKAAPAEPPRVPGGFSVRASNGYVVSVVSSANRRTGEGHVTVFARSRRAAVTYAVPASVTETSIEADLGAVGRIDVDFLPTGKTRTERLCGGDDPFPFDSGRYVGTIDFKGEHGYSEAHASTARGSISGPYAFMCGSDISATAKLGEGSRPAGARLNVLGGASLYFLRVTKDSPSARSRFEASIEEQRGEITIARFVEAFGGADAFDYDLASDFARVEPPAPFSGWGIFRREAGETRWRGRLRADFPGRPNVILRAAASAAGLERAPF